MTTRKTPPRRPAAAKDQGRDKRTSEKRRPAPKDAVKAAPKAVIRGSDAAVDSGERSAKRKTSPGRPAFTKDQGRNKRASEKRRAAPKDIPKAIPVVAPGGSEDAAGRGERIAKVMARAGLCSRREAETWIENGRVELNGQKLTTPAITVTPNDKVVVDGKLLPTRERTRLWLYHKPRGLVTTNKDPEGRPTVFERLPAELPRVLTVGRLDINTEGLLLLTNDGGLARVLELPATGWLRRYRVRAFGKVTQADLDGLKDGIAIEGALYGAIEATLDKEQGGNSWMTVGLREGKNREVKRVLEHLGLTVNRLIRLSYGPFQLMDLPEGDVREIRGRVLRDQLGDTLAEEAGADFDAPLFHAPKPEAEKKPSGTRQKAGRAGEGQPGERREAGGQGKWMTAREGKTVTDRHKAAKSRRSDAARPDGEKDRKPGKRKPAGPKKEKVSPRSRFRMTTDAKPRRDAGEQRFSAPPRKIWGDEGLVEDKHQESRSEAEKRARSGPPKGGRGPRGGGRS